MSFNVITVVCICGLAIIKSGISEDLRHLCHGGRLMVVVAGDGSMVVVKEEDGPHILNCIKNGAQENNTDCQKLPAEKKIFYLLTKKNPKKHQVLETGNRRVLDESNFNKSLDTKIIFHAWMDDPIKTKLRGTVNAMLKNYDYNIILVDWSKYSKNPYTLAVIYVQHVARQVGNFVLFLMSYGVEPSSLHFIGFSLGAQLASYTTLNLKGKKIGRLTGLDAAAPLICAKKLEPLIIKSNVRHNRADFVDLIHTSELGIQKPAGSVDFYPDGGIKQQSCGWEIPIFPICSHTRAVHYYTQTVGNPDRHVGVKCRNFKEMRRNKCSGVKTVMGFSTPTTTRGIFYVDVGKDWQHLPARKNIAGKISSSVIIMAANTLAFVVISQIK